MAKHLNVSLDFNANVDQAKKNLQSLQESLNKITSMKPGFNMEMTKGLREAITSADTLKAHLNNAFNTKTGNLDLSKLNASLKSAGTDLATLSSGLLKAGLNGEQAFMNIQRSIATASVQIKQANGLLANFWTTLKNTARWQLSSSVLHGFMGAMQSAYGYAQDLDKSLNNIRIVTGYNKDIMADFAEQANKAAKALSTTTTAYTDASLIFYQQGLTGDAVTERTNTVIKMANVTGEAAADVSDYMTAVWNNFYDGSKSLEYYADVMTALGAATASSTDEIAAGLEKFAAVAETVGLSYEYATAALATVTAETRQSADVVGTAFKTLFARLQDLELGETLDDGTTLGTYSQALAKVGVSITDTTGAMKDMDVILEEMAAKWGDLSAAQQTALAQNVAGVRQYTQLIALMNNWDKMQENLGTVTDSEGTLQSQADIYEESWKAASKRVKASLEGLYNDLIPKDFIISVTDATGDVIEAVDAIVNGFGGLENILLLIANIALTKLGPALTVGINNGLEKLKEFPAMIQNFDFKGMFVSSTKNSEVLANNIDGIYSGLKNATESSKYFKDNFEKAKNVSNETKQSQESITKAISDSNNGIINLSSSFKQYLGDTSKVYNIQALIEQHSNKLTAAEKERLSIMQQQLISLSEQKKGYSDQLELLERRQQRLITNTDPAVFLNDNYFERERNPEKKNSTGSSRLDLDVSADYKERLEAQIQSLGIEKEINTFVQETSSGLRIQTTSYEGIGIIANKSVEKYRETLSLNDKIRNVLSTQAATEQDKEIHQKNQLSAIKDILTKQASSNNIAKDVAQRYLTIFENAKNSKDAVTQLSTEMARSQGEARGFAQLIGTSEENLNAVLTNQRLYNEELWKQSQAQIEFNNKLNETLNYLSTAASKTQTLGGYITSGFQGLSTVAMGINSVINSVKTLNDESASFGQKLVSFAMAATMGLSALKTVTTGVISTINILSATKTKQAAIDTALNGLVEKQIITEQGLNAVRIEGIIIDNINNANSPKEIMALMNEIGVKITAAEAENLYNMRKKEGIGLTLKQILVDKKAMAVKAASLGPLLAVVAAVAAVVAIYKIWSDATVSQAEKTEKLRQAVNDLNESEQELKETAKGLSDAFDNYTEAIDALNECTRGTDAWNEALKNVEESIDSIFEKYPYLKQVADLLEWDEASGTYIINQDKFEEEKQKAEEAARAGEYASNLSEAKLKQQELEEQEQSIVEKVKAKQNGYAMAAYYANIGNNIDLTQISGNRKNDEDVVSKWIYDGIYEFLKQNTTEYAEKDQYGNLLTDESGNIIYNEDKLAIGIESYKTQIEELNEEIFNMVSGYGDINNEISSIIDSSSKLVIQDKYEDQGLSQQELDAVAKVTSQREEALYKYIYGEDGTGDALIADYNKGSGKIDPKEGELLWWFEQAMGGEIQWANNTVRGNDAKREFYYMDGKDEKSYTAEEVAQKVAAYMALEGYDFEDHNKNNPDDYQQKAINVISEALQNATGMGADFITGLTNTSLETGMANFAAKLTESEINSLTENGNFDYEKFKTLTGFDETKLDELAKQFGTTLDVVIETLINGFGEVEQTINEEEREKYLANIKTDDLSYEEQQNLVNAAKSAQKNASEKVSLNLSGINSQNADNVEGLTNFYEGLSNIDLHAEDATDQIQELAKQYGISGASLTSFINEVDKLPKTFKISTAEVSENIAELKNITKDLNLGDVISQEDFDKLESAGIEVESYFTKMDDGTWKLIRDAEEFKNIVSSYAIEELLNISNKFDQARGQTGYNGTNGSSEAGLSYIKSFGDYDFKTEGANEVIGAEDFTAIKQDPEKLAIYESMLQELSQYELDVDKQIASTATSLEELNKIIEEQDLLVDYSDALVELGSRYEECEDEVRNYQIALKKSGKGSDEAKKAQERLEKALRKVKWDKFADDALGYARALNGLKDTKKIEDNLLGIQKALKDNFNMDVSLDQLYKYKDDFIAWGQATEEDADDIFTHIYSKINAENFDLGEWKDQIINISADSTEAETVMNDLAIKAEQMKAIIENNEPTVKANGEADFSNLILALLEAGGTAADVAAALAMIGQTEVDFSGWSTGDLKLGSYDFSDPKSTTQFIQDFKGWTGGIKVKAPGAESTVDAINQVFKGDIKAVTGTGGGISSSSDTSDSGGSSVTTEAEDKSKYEVVDRYKEVTDSLDDNAEALEKVGTAADNAYGINRINNLKQINKLLKEENKLLSKKRQENVRYLDEDRTTAEQAAYDAAETAGIDMNDPAYKKLFTLSYDDNGNITNYTAILEELFKKRDEYKNQIEQDKEVTEEEAKKLQDIDDYIEKFKNSVSDYDETLSIQAEIDSESIDNFNEQLSNNFESLNLQFELQVEFDSIKMDYLEYELSKIEDSVYSIAEAAILTSGKLNRLNDDGTYADGTYLNNLANLESLYDKLNEDYANGDILQSDYAEGMKEISENILTELENIQELDVAMREYYGNTLDMAQEKLSSYTSLLEHSSSVLEHYLSMTDLFSGGEADFESIGVILEAQAKVAEDAYRTSAETFQMYQQQANDRYAEYQDAINRGVEGVTLEAYEQRWLDAQEASNEAQDQMLSDAADWAEKMQAQLDNALGQFAQELENALTGEFGSFDAMSTSLERAQSLQEDYLTTTNKIYETNKLMRTAQSEYDKSTNSVSKKRLKAFIEETDNLQNKNKLSKYELEIQQAKYDLLLAEIALKDAQNAKSTVRLQRDSEGNFGYVYSANQNAIEEAQQKYDDAQNNLYNKGLDGANNYVQKYQQTMSEMYDTLTDIQNKYNNKEYASEAEYQAAMASAKEHYFAKLREYSEQYQIALGADSRIAADAWSTDFANMTTDTAKWESEVNTYLRNVSGAFSTWGSELQTLRQSTLGNSLIDLKNKTSDITTKSKELSSYITTNLIPTLTTQLDKVGQVTAGYLAQRESIQGLINDYKSLGQAALDAAETQATTVALTPGDSVTVREGVTKWQDTPDGQTEENSTKGVKGGSGYSVIKWSSNQDYVLISNGTGSYGWVKKTDLVGFDTGGYTGEWGSYGKMAMVHEKELILNANDTENLLASMEFLSRVLELIDLQAVNSQISNITSPALRETANGGTVEQNVRIEASFPNVSDRNEIEEAFNNLINTSSQYANRK